MNKSWINTNRTLVEYINGVQSFLDFAFANVGGSKMILCLCNRCKVGFNRDEVIYHLMFNGFWPSHQKWVHHRESFSMQSTSIPHNASDGGTGVNASIVCDVGTNGLLNDIFEIYNEGNDENNDAPSTWNIFRILCLG